MARYKVGILGGTFDPPHEGHLKISKFVIRKLKLRSIIWAITKKNPFKKNPLISLNRRIFLSRILTKNNKKIKIKSYDQILKTSKTISLIKFLKKNNKNTNFFFLIGSDNLINLHKWEKWRTISELCKIVVLRRRGFIKKSLNSHAFKQLGSEKVIYLKSPMLNISSSKLRKNYLI
tara:strand:- start:1015 stop:1542 length:528 start_codon:yes stop_codon:yes gene_type:complete